MVRTLRERGWAGAALALVAIPAFLVLTNYWTGQVHPWGGDVLSYQAIAEAAPGLPHLALGSAYTQRFVPNYLVGLFVWSTGLGMHAGYRLVWALALVALVVAFARGLLAARTSQAVFVIAFALFACNPYSLRESILVPGSVEDLTFVVGLGVLMWGLLDRSFALVLLGSAVAILSRQSELVVAPVAAFWVLRGPGWREQEDAVRRLRAIAVLALTAVLYAGVDLLTWSFSTRFEPSFPHDTILPLLVPTGGHLSTLASHLGRCLIPLLVPAAVLLGALVTGRSRDRRARLPFEFYASLAIAAAVIVQPLGVSPAFPGFAHNEQRLVGIGLLPLAVAAAIALQCRTVARERLQDRFTFSLVLGALLVGSLHHIFTRIGPLDLEGFVALQLLAALIVFGALAIPIRVGRLSGPRRTLPQTVDAMSTRSL
jgi:hypothetical protein